MSEERDGRTTDRPEPAPAAGSGDVQGGTPEQGEGVPDQAHRPESPSGSVEHDDEDEAIRAIAEGASSPRLWRVLAAVQFVIILGAGGAVALMASLELGPFGAEGAAEPSEKGEVWICPMHPQVKQDRPGTCPICAMALVKKDEAPAGGADHAGHGDEDAADLSVPGLAPVTPPTSYLQTGSVRLAVVRKARLGHEVRTVGRIEADETRLADVHSQVSGWLTTLDVDQTGQFVVRGDRMLEIFSRDVLQAEQELLAFGGRRGAEPSPIGSPIRTIADAAEQRLLVFGMPPDVIAEVKRSGRPRGTVPVRSPITGFVLTKHVVNGMYVEPGMKMFTIASLSNVWVWGDLYEKDLAFVRLGDRAEIRTLALGNRVFEGKVTFFDPVVDERTRTLRVRVEIPNWDLALRPGMWTSVRLIGDEEEVAAVPYDAVVDTGRERYVFVQTAPGKFVPRLVTTGRSDRDLVEIASGLDVGDVVVASGTFLIDSESRLSGGGTAGGAHAGHGEGEGSAAAPGPQAAPASHEGHGAGERDEIGETES